MRIDYRTSTSRYCNDSSIRLPLWVFNKELSVQWRICKCRVSFPADPFPIMFIHISTDSWKIISWSALINSAEAPVKFDSLLCLVKWAFPLQPVNLIKGCVLDIFASLFCKSKREHLWHKEKCFFFISLRKLFLFFR